MAKKRRVDTVDEKPPEFDRAEFIRRELLDAKVSFIVIILGIVMGIISGVLFGVNAGVSAALGLIAMLFLPYIIRLTGIDLKKELLSDEKKKLPEEERKSEFRGYIMKNIGMIGTYFLIWLSIFVLTMNAPFSDFSAPAYLDVKAKLGDEAFVPLIGNEIKIITNTTTGKKITLSASITDNTAVDTDSVKFTIDGREYKPVRTGDTYEVSNIPPTSPMDVRLDASDTLGHHSSLSFRILIVTK